MSAEKAKRDRYRKIFKESKVIIVEWEAQFQAQNQGRKPRKSDYEEKAPPKISQCYRNCQKIKKYFQQLAPVEGDKEDKNKDSEKEKDSGDKPRLNFSGLFSTSSRTPPGTAPPSPGSTSSKSSCSTPCQDISNVLPGSSANKVWGTHVLTASKKSRSVPADSSSSGPKWSEKKIAPPSDSTLVTQAPPTRTRSTLKKKKKRPAAAAAGDAAGPILRTNSVTFDTLGLDENSQDSQFSPPSSTALNKAKSDPLARFDPAISNLDTSDAFLMADSILSGKRCFKICCFFSLE